ncbi:MAG TPA: hypothetical protein PLU47_07880, partial [Azonexus sp.]|nr:hypothetical protein [Azonexus sp.]
SSEPENLKIFKYYQAESISKPPRPRFRTRQKGEQQTPQQEWPQAIQRETKGRRAGPKARKAPPPNQSLWSTGKNSQNRNQLTVIGCCLLAP